MKKKKPHRGRARKAKEDFAFYRHPFADADPAEIKAALLELADRKIAEFPEMIKTLQEMLRAKYPPHILSVLAGYGLRAGVSSEGVSEKRLMSKIEQHHVELLQALMLTIPMEEWGETPAAPQDIQTVIDTLADVADAFHLRRFSAIQEVDNPESRAILGLQERIRMHTQVVRNWGYFSEVVQISTELYSPLDETFKATHGFGPSDLIAVARQLVKLLEERGGERLRLFGRIFREKRIKRLVRLYYAKFPDVEGDPEEFIKIIPEGSTWEGVAGKLRAHADLSLATTMCVKPEDLVETTGLSAEVVTGILIALSYQPGDLKDESPEHFFMGNPIWEHPLIWLGDSFFCPVPQGIFSHIHDVMRWLAGEAGAKDALEARRSAYLEDKAGRLLSLALPSATIRHNVKWRSGDEEFETDHLAVIDRTAVIIEDKSGSLTASGLRGAPDRVRRHIDELVISPSVQSARLEALIERARTGNAEAVASLAPFGIDLAQIERIIRISVTLDDFSILSAAEKEMQDTGWIPDGLALATTLNVADFQMVIDILEDQAFFLYYFTERARFQKSFRILADEMDFLGFYLATGFNVGDLEKQRISLALTGMSAVIDKYCINRDAGVMLPKPKPKLTPYFARLIRSIEARSLARWSIMTTDLLRCANYDEQKRLDKALTKLKANVERHWREPEHDCSIVVTPPEVRDTAIVFYAYPPPLAEQRRKIAEELAAKALSISHRERCVLICRNTSRWDEPYASIIIANASAPER